MKKLLAILMSLAMVFAFAGCGGAKDGGETGGENKQEAVIYAGWFSAEMPEGFEAESDEQDRFINTANDEESFDVEVSFSGDGAKAMCQQNADITGAEVKEVTYGDRTWYYYDAEFHGLPSGRFMTDLDGDYYAEMFFFCMAPDDERVVKFLETFETVENPYDANMEFLNSL